MLPTVCQSLSGIFLNQCCPPPFPMSSYTCLIFLVFVGYVTAAVYIEYQKPQPGKAPFCVDKIEGKKRVGEEWQDPKECIHKKCLTDSQGTPLITYASCGTVVPPEECRLETPDITNSTYPDCCPKVVCD